MKCKCCGAISIEPVHLTERETEVLVHLCKGYTIKEIAARVGMSWFTAHTHIRALYWKLGVASRAEAAIAACRMGMPV